MTDYLNKSPRGEDLYKKSTINLSPSITSEVSIYYTTQEEISSLIQLDLNLKSYLDPEEVNPQVLPKTTETKYKTNILTIVFQTYKNQIQYKIDKTHNVFSIKQVREIINTILQLMYYSNKDNNFIFKVEPTTKDRYNFYKNIIKRIKGEILYDSEQDIDNYEHYQYKKEIYDIPYLIVFKSNQLNKQYTI